MLVKKFIRMYNKKLGIFGGLIYLIFDLTWTNNGLVTAYI